jgi:hypothetical protein
MHFCSFGTPFIRNIRYNLEVLVFNNLARDDELVAAVSVPELDAPFVFEQAHVQTLVSAFVVGLIEAPGEVSRKGFDPCS